MSASFKVGDRVRNKVGNWLGTVTAIGQGSPHAMGGTGTMRVHEDNTPAPIGYYAEYFDLISSSPSIGDLVPSGAKVDAGPAFQIASSGGAGYYTGLGGYIGVTGTLRAAPSWTSPNLDDLRRDMAELMTARGDLLAAREEHRAMRAALDTVRKFLGAHSFASCSLACNRELREVMAVVLEALDAGKASK